jgi:hypothetical protein
MGVDPGPAGADELYRMIGAERDGAVEGLIDAGIVEGDNGHPPVGHVLQQQRLLQRPLVEGVRDEAEAIPGKVGAFVVDRNARGHVGDLLHGDDDVHAPVSLRAASAEQNPSQRLARDVGSRKEVETRTYPTAKTNVKHTLQKV